MHSKQLLCRSWKANLSKLFLALMGEAMLRASDGYEDLPSSYEFEKRYLMPAYFILANRGEILTEEQLPAFEAAIDALLDQAPEVKISFDAEGFFEMQMPLATYKGEWQINNGILAGAFMMRSRQSSYLPPPGDWQLSANGESLQLRQPFLNALSLAIPLRITLPFPIHFEAQVAEISQNRLIINYRSPRGLMNAQFSPC